MLALPPSLFLTCGCPLGDSISHEQKTCKGSDLFVNCNLGEIETIEPFLCFPSLQPQIGVDHSRPSSETSGDPYIVKKLSHNASERDRRKKLNNLYSSLRSLLPETDQTKKLSIPSTVSRVLKYIPELQKQVERLIRRKEEILSSISKKGDVTHIENVRKGPVRKSLPTVLASRIDDKEVLIQICTLKMKRNLLSDILLNLEEEGLRVLNASAFASFGERVFYNLHLQMKGAKGVECEVLSQKLLSMYANEEELF